MFKHHLKRHHVLIVTVCALLAVVLGAWHVARTQTKKAWRGADVETALTRLGHNPDEALYLHRLTAYNATAHQTDANPATSSCGPTQKNQIALSRDLFFHEDGSKHLCGVKALLLVVDPDTGRVTAKHERVIWDTMDERFERTADVLVQGSAKAEKWGVKEGAIIVLEQTAQASN